ncbi:MAG: hypothetical protein RML47_09985, partial [Bacteroidota bacterium]|nr:hypothetical protein [Bacteroidota bacterium]
LGRGRKVFLDSTREAVGKLFDAQPGTGRVFLGLEQDADIGQFDAAIPALTIRGVSIEMSNQVSVVSGGLIVSEDNVRFAPGDFVAFSDGRIEIPEIRNTEPVAYEFVRIVLKGLRRAPFGPADSVVIRFEGAVDRPDQYLFRRLEAGEVRRGIQIPVRGMRLYPVRGQLGYDVFARPTQFRAESNPRAIVIQLGVERVAVSQVQARLVPRTILLSEDRNRDGRLDIARVEESRITRLSDLRNLSQVIQNLKLSGAQMTLEYQTNLLMGGVLYGVFEGRRADGSRIELVGRGPYALTAADTVGGFLRGGQAIRPTIKFPLPRPASATQTIRLLLDDGNSNLSQFLSALPVEVRFTGKFLLNPTGEAVVLNTPVTFRARIRFQLPLSLENTLADPVVLTDTVEADLSDLPKNEPQDELRLLSGRVRLSYRNGLPMGIRISEIGFLDEARRPLAVRIPKPGQVLELSPAPVDAAGLSSGRATGALEIGLEESELNLLHRTRHLRLVLRAGAARPGAVIRAQDRLAVDLTASLQLNVKVRP